MWNAKNNNDPVITLWGTGIARREFLHVNDFAKAILHFFENYNSPKPINIGPGNDISIKELATLMASKIEYQGQIIWDDTKPNGMLQKCMDVTNMKNEGFKPTISLETGIDEVIESYKNIVQ